MARIMGPQVQALRQQAAGVGGPDLLIRTCLAMTAAHASTSSMARSSHHIVAIEGIEGAGKTTCGGCKDGFKADLATYTQV